MTYYGAIRVLEGRIYVSSRPHAEVMQEAINTAIDALYEIDKIKSHGCDECSNLKEGDCDDCAFGDQEEWQEPCKMCKRNCKDYYRKAVSEPCYKYWEES